MDQRYERIIVPMTGDLLTKGHVFLIEAALKIGQRVKVLVSDSDHKRGQTVRNPEERLPVIERHFADHPERARLSFRACADRTISDILLEEDTFTLVNGIRNADDETVRERQETLLRLVLPEVRILAIATPDDLRNVSSTAAKAFILHDLAEASDLAANPSLVATYRHALRAESWFGLTRDPAVPDDIFAAFQAAWKTFVTFTKDYAFAHVGLDGLSSVQAAPGADRPWLRRAHADRLVRRQLAKAHGDSPKKLLFVCLTGSEEDRRRWDGGLTLHLSAYDPADGRLSVEAVDWKGRRHAFAPRKSAQDLPALFQATYETLKLWHKEGRLP